MADYDKRLATRIAAGVDARLRLLALLRGQCLSHVITDLLDQALPDLAVMAGQLQEGSRRP